MEQNSDESKRLFALRGEMKDELINDILPYWTIHAKDLTNGGFIGQVTGQGRRITCADKSVILNARLLWTYSSAYHVLKKETYRMCADRAFDYLETHFYDTVNGGFFWSVDYRGEVSDEKKHAYAQAFAIYAYSEYALATGLEKAVNRAMESFELLVKHGYDDDTGGYAEAFTKSWKPLEDVRLSKLDMQADRSMNTHLHILEAYTNLLRIRNDEAVKEKLRSLIHIHLETIYNTDSCHFDSFFDQNWRAVSNVYSYGHDIEAAWLIVEAAGVLDNSDLLKMSTRVLLDVAETIFNEGVSDQAGGVYYTGRNGTPFDTDFHWWVQAEAIVGFLVAYRMSGNNRYLDAAGKIWQFVKAHIVDSEHGEWYFRVNEQGNPYLQEDKIGPWKCPYHNSRACLVLIEQFK